MSNCICIGRYNALSVACVCLGLFTQSVPFAVWSTVHRADTAAVAAVAASRFPRLQLSIFFLSLLLPPSLFGVGKVVQPPPPAQEAPSTESPTTQQQTPTVYYSIVRFNQRRRQRRQLQLQTNRRRLTVRFSVPFSILHSLFCCCLSC